jgi:hypothetical protein
MQRRNAVETHQLSLYGVPGPLAGKYRGRRAAITDVQFTYRIAVCHWSSVHVSAAGLAVTGLAELLLAVLTGSMGLPSVDVTVVINAPWYRIALA